VKPTRVIVTGERDEWGGAESIQPPVDWASLPVLAFERLAIKPELLDRFSVKPAEWIVFTSPRAVQFWTETLLEHGSDLPAETRVACLGERTAQAAEADGYTVDFIPKEPGTDGFLESFEKVAHPGSVLIPAAEGGRPRLRERLNQQGFEVTWLPLYRTYSRTDVAEQWEGLNPASAEAIVFTSPSSVDAVLDVCELPEHLKVLAIGGFTGQHLERRGVVRPPLLPNGDFSRIREVL
jgi:uroporphyrinogen-III synthase